MSWADIARSSSKNGKPTQQTVSKLLVQYSYQPPSIINESIDDIPLRREKTPHPADDFLMTNGLQLDTTMNKNANKNKSFVDYWPKWNGEWIDYAKDTHLRQFKKTLPLNIQ